MAKLMSRLAGDGSRSLQRVMRHVLVGMSLITAASTLTACGSGSSTATATEQAFGSNTPISYSTPTTLGEGTLPSESTASQVFLAGGARLNKYLKQLDFALKSKESPPTNIGFFGTVLSVSAKNNRLVVSNDALAAKSSTGDVADTTTYAGNAGAPITVNIASDTDLQFLSHGLLGLRRGAPVFVGGTRNAAGIEALLIADPTRMFQSDASTGSPSAALSTDPTGSSRSNNASPSSLIGRQMDPAHLTGLSGSPTEAHTAAELTAVSSTTSSAPAAPNSSTPQSEIAANGDNTVTLSGTYGIPGIYPHFDASIGNINGPGAFSCGVSLSAGIFLGFGSEFNWPFQFGYDGNGFAVTSIDRQEQDDFNVGPISGQGSLTGDFGQYSIYSGYGIIVGASLTVGCTIKVFGVSTTLQLGIGTAQINFASQNETTRHVPLAGEQDLTVPPDSCLNADLTVSFLTVGIGTCQFQTFQGRQFHATVTGVGGVPQPISAGYDSEIDVQHSTDPSGGPVTVNDFSYAPELTTKMVAGLFLNVDLLKLKNHVDDSVEPPTANEYKSYERNKNQIGPITPEGDWQNGNNRLWYDESGKVVPAPTAEEITQGNANWEHPNQSGDTYSDGRWMDQQGRWHLPNGKYATAPPPGDSPNPQANGDDQGEGALPQPSLASDLHGWNYETNSTSVQLVLAPPASLTLTVPVLSASCGTDQLNSAVTSYISRTTQYTPADYTVTNIKTAGLDPEWASFSLVATPTGAATFQDATGVAECTNGWQIEDVGGFEVGCTTVPVGLESQLGLSCPSSSSSTTTTTQPISPGNNSPEAAVDGAISNILGDDLAGSCQYLAPAFQSDCQSAAGSPDSVTGAFSITGEDISVNEALVSLTGNECQNGSCVTNSDPDSGMPPGAGSFADAYAAAAAAVSPSNPNPSPLSPVPCIEIGGKWYVNVDF